MATHFFDVHNNDVMGWGFSHKPLAGYFHFLGNLLSLNLNGGYPIIGFSEKRLLNNLARIVDDFRKQKNMTDQIVGFGFKARIDGKYYFYTGHVDTEGNVDQTRIALEDVVEQILPEKVQGGLRHGDFYVKPEGQTLWLFNFLYHVLLSMDAETGKIQVYTRDELIDQLLDFDPRFLITEAEKLIRQPQGMGEAPEMAFSEDQLEKLLQKITNAVTEWLTDDHINSLKLESVKLELSGQTALRKQWARLFSFKCIANFESIENLTLYTDKENFWMYSELENEKTGETLKTIEPLAKDEILNKVLYKLKRQVEFDVNGKASGMTPSSVN